MMNSVRVVVAVIPFLVVACGSRPTSEPGSTSPVAGLAKYPSFPIKDGVLAIEATAVYEADNAWRLLIEPEKNESHFGSVYDGKECVICGTITGEPFSKDGIGYVKISGTWPATHEVIACLMFDSKRNSDFLNSGDRVCARGIITQSYTFKSFMVKNAVLTRRVRNAFELPLTPSD